jgi:hypothetical protein
MDHKAGCSVALVGCAIAVISVTGGVWGALGAATYEHWGEMQACLGLALVGGMIGFIVSAVGIVMALSGGKEQDSSPDSLEKRPPEEHLCRNCGCRVADGSKTCEWCGADLK